MTEFRVAVFLPRSSLYPSISIDLVSGLKAGLRHKNIDSIKLLFENIGFGEDSASIYAKTEKCLLQEDVQMIIAYMDYTEAFKLEPLFAGMNKLLLILDPGAHVPVSWNSSPYCFTISLQAALGSRLTGQLAGKEGAVKPIFATSFYEGGYLQCFSYLKGIENGGGQIQSNVVVPFKLQEFTIKPLLEAVQQRQPDSIIAQFSAEAGEIFLKEYVATGLQSHLRFYSSPFMMEETWLSTVTYPFDGIKGYVTWLRNLHLKANQLFLEKIEEETGKAGNIFSMLGWEAAQFTSEAHSIWNKNNKTIRHSLEELENIIFESPRGTLKMHRSTHHFIAPMYLTEIVRDENNKCKLIFISENTSINEQFEEYVQDKPVGTFSKWTNTYLCI